MSGITQQTTAGWHIGHACRQMSLLAKQLKRLVRFNFNGRHLIAAPKKSPYTLLWEWETENDRLAHTTEAKARRQKHEEWVASETNLRQNTVDSLLTMVPRDFASPETTIYWLKQFANVADWTRCKFDKEAISLALVEAGYVENAHVGIPFTDTTTRQHKIEYLVWQAINCLNIGMPPHPIIVSFVEEMDRTTPFKEASEALT